MIFSRQSVKFFSASLLLILPVGLNVSFADSEKPVLPKGEAFHVYLVLGKTGMVKPVAAPEEMEPLERCFLLSAEGEWEQALTAGDNIIGSAGGARTGPLPSFAQAMLKQDASVTIGLVIRTQPETNIEEWGMKTKAYRAARKAGKTAAKDGTLKGILWQGSGAKSPLFTDLDHLKTLFSNFRTDLRLLNLPVVLGEAPKSKSATTQIRALADDVHATASVAPGAGGSGYAQAMLKLHREWPDDLPAPEPDIPLIDPHIHAMANKPGGLDPVVAWMERNGIERCITSPIGDSRPKNAQEREVMLANHRKYRGKIERYFLIKPGEVSSVEEAVKILEAEKAAGAVGFGEHYGHDLMFDDPKNLILYEACAKVGLPVMFHIDASKNMVEQGMRRVERVLEMYPDCKIIAHAYWWLHLPDGTCDRMLSRHPNLYADVSGTRMVGVLNRDRGYTREFLNRHQDRILFATDAGWWSFKKPKAERELQFELFEQLGLSDAVKRKIYRYNAAKLFGFE